MLQHLRHETNKHEPAYFAAVYNLSDKQLTNFSGMRLFLGVSLAGALASPVCLASYLCSSCASKIHTFPRHFFWKLLERFTSYFRTSSTQLLDGFTRHLADSYLGDDPKEVRIAESAYGMHLFGKVLLPDSDPSHAYPEK